jgi:hypothetical protein
MLFTSIFACIQFTSRRPGWWPRSGSRRSSAWPSQLRPQWKSRLMSPPPLQIASPLQIPGTGKSSYLDDVPRRSFPWEWRRPYYFRFSFSYPFTSTIHSTSENLQDPCHRNLQYLVQKNVFIVGYICTRVDYYIWTYSDRGYVKPVYMNNILMF